MQYHLKSYCSGRFYIHKVWFSLTPGDCTKAHDIFEIVNQLGNIRIFSMRHNSCVVGALLDGVPPSCVAFTAPLQRRRIKKQIKQEILEDRSIMSNPIWSVMTVWGPFHGTGCGEPHITRAPQGHSLSKASHSPLCGLDRGKKHTVLFTIDRV